MVPGHEKLAEPIRDRERANTTVFRRYALAELVARSTIVRTVVGPTSRR